MCPLTLLCVWRGCLRMGRLIRLALTEYPARLSAASGLRQVRVGGWRPTKRVRSEARKFRDL